VISAVINLDRLHGDGDLRRGERPHPGAERCRGSFDRRSSDAGVGGRSAFRPLDAWVDLCQLSRVLCAEPSSVPKGRCCAGLSAKVGTENHPGVMCSTALPPRLVRPGRVAPPVSRNWSESRTRMSPRSTPFPQLSSARPQSTRPTRPPFTFPYPPAHFPGGGGGGSAL